MKTIRARFLLAVIVAADATIVVGGIPLLHDTYMAVSQRAGDMPLLLQLLLANVAMLLLVIAAMFAYGMLGVRAVRSAIKCSPIFFEQPIQAQRTRYPR